MIVPTISEKIISFKRLGLNTLWLLLARVFAQALMLGFTALIARRLGADGFGQYTFVAAVVFLGNVFSTFGTDTLLIREIARTRNPATGLVSAMFWIQIALSVLFIALVIAYTWLAKPELALALPLYSLSLVPLAFYTIYSAILRAFERMDLFLLLNLATSILFLLAATIVFFAPADLMALVLLLLLAQTLSAVFANALVQCVVRVNRIVFRIPDSFVPILRAALPFAVFTILAVIYQRLGVLMLTWLGGNDATGWFAAASRIVEAIRLAPQAVLGALFPVLSRAMISERLSPWIRETIKLSLGFSAIAIVVLVILAQPIILLIYGNRFEPAVGALQILVWSLIPYVVTASISLALVSRRKEWRVFGGTLVGVLTAFFLLLILIPRFGIIGASWAWLIAETIQAILFLGLSKAEAI